MFVLNGIVYGGKPSESISIKAIKPLPDKILLVTFSTGETRVFDATILKGEVFEKLNDPEIFNNVCIDHGVATWDDGAIDCAPEFMYANSYEYTQVI